MIITYSAKFEKQIIEVADLCLGKGFLGEAEIRQLLFYNCIALLKIEEEKVIGFCFTICADNKILEKTFKVPTTLLGTKSSLLKTIAVHPHYQGKGIAKELIHQSIHQLIRNRVNVCLTFAWTHHGKTNLEGPLKQNLFTPTMEIKNYWAKESLVKNYVCPLCSGPPCTCSAMIYSLVLPQSFPK